MIDSGCAVVTMGPCAVAITGTCILHFTNSMGVRTREVNAPDTAPVKYNAERGSGLPSA